MDILRLIADERCVACAARGALLCAACRRRLPWTGGARCARCGEPGPPTPAPCAGCARLGRHVAAAHAALLLDGPAAALLRGWKDEARAGVGRIAAACVAGAIPRPAADAIAPVPAARERAAWRGVDGPRDLAAALGREWGLPLADDALVRVHDRPQRGLGASARRRNAAGAFVATGPATGRVVLVDDVLTTGATVRAAALALRRAGAERVEVVTLARVRNDRVKAASEVLRGAARGVGWRQQSDEAEVSR